LDGTVVVGATVVGAMVVGAMVVGAMVVGAMVVGATVVGSVAGPAVVGAGVSVAARGAVCELAGESALEVCEQAERPTSALDIQSQAIAVRVEVMWEALGRGD